jgi:hypothetical protein
MIYLACDNNLSAEGIRALKELKRLGIGPRKDVTVIAQFDPNSGPEPDPTLPTGIPTLRFVLSQNADDFTLLEDVDGQAGETNTGDKGTLSEFLKWGVENYSADHYMVILSGHGAGVEPGFLLHDEGVPLDDPEDVVRNYLLVSELREVLAGMSAIIRRKIDIVGFDNCLMSMAEVGNELYSSVKYLISSEGFDPNGGWPYFRMVAPLVEEPSCPLKKLCHAIVGNYILYYGDFILGGTSVDLSALDLSKSEALVAAMQGLSRVLIKELEKPNRRDTIVLAHWRAQSYNGERFVDLFDFCDLLAKSYVRGPVARACGNVKTVIASMVAHSCYAGTAFQYSYGVSIYFPWADVDGYYKNLSFANSSGWLDFLHEYVGSTRREPRDVDRKGKAAGAARKQKKIIPQSGFPGIIVRLPPEDRGPGANIKSMRNPPQGFFASNCLEFDDAD